MTMPKKIIWPQEHENLLRQLYATTPISVIALQLNRRNAEVKDRARLLGLKSLPRNQKLRPLYYYDGRPKFKLNDDGCWIWIAAINAKGYPISRGGKDTTLVYRQIYIDTHGAIRKGFTVDHKCRNRACVNVDHLEAVKHYVNVRRGSLRKLTVDQVRAIRANRKSSDAQLAKEYNVCQANIYSIRRRISWKKLA
jgi:hypothetical protein